jgi:hypothetical protein
MLSPGDFSVGCIGDVTTSLTLVMPRGHYEHPMLVTQASGSPYAVFLAGEYRFLGFECGNNDSWKGILIPNVTIEMDDESIFEAEDLHSPFGALVRRGTQLDVVTRTDGGFPRPVKKPLIVGLPPCRLNMAAGFTRWRICLGEGTRKRELKRVDSSSKPLD